MREKIKIKSSPHTVRHENGVFDMLGFSKYGLYAISRFALFKERRVQIKTGRELKQNDPKNYR